MLSLSLQRRAERAYSKGNDVQKWVLAFIIAVGLFVGNQGLATIEPPLDLAPQVRNAMAFLQNGTIPSSGTLTSFASYTPPGTTWLLIPGVLLFRDDRLAHIPGAAFLYIVGCIGLYLLAKRLFDSPTALITTAAFAWSSVGLFYASSLWQRAHPSFYIWMAYLCVLWVQKRNAWYLAAALVVYVVGLYVFMELLPAILFIPILWILFRPPISIKPIFAASLTSVVIWLPYLIFQAGRGFMDLQSQILRQNILPADPRAFWCNSTYQLLGRTPDGSQEFYLPLILLLLIVTIYVIFRSRKNSWIWLLAAPLAFMLVFTEYGRWERLWWLFAFQMLFLVALLPRPWKFAIVIVVLIAPIYIQRTMTTRLLDWVAHGYGGVTMPAMQQVEALGAQLSEQGITETSIGYRIPVFGFEADYHAVDPRYKVGMEYDLWLERYYGIHNTDTCAEGVSGNDQWVIKVG